MDRALAQRYGSTYVHAAAFAIDIDRVHEQCGDDESWPFGWEVLLTEAYLAHFLGGPIYLQLLEDMCLQVLDLPKLKQDQQAPLGSQITFAMYAAVAHKQLP